MGKENGDTYWVAPGLLLCAVRALLALGIVEDTVVGRGLCEETDAPNAAFAVGDVEGSSWN